MEKILDIIDMIAYEKGIEPDIVCNIVKDGLIKIAQEEINPNYEYFVEQDLKNRTLRLFYKILVCADDDERLQEDNLGVIALSKVRQEAQNMEQDISIGDTLEYELSLDSMKRGAINKLFLTLEINLQRQIEDQLLSNLKSKLNKIVAGVVVGVDKEENTFVEISGIRAVLAKKNRIKGEQFKVGQTIRALLKFVGVGKGGIRLELSRTAPKFLEELLTLEVPELKDEEIHIHKSARIPGERAKIAIFTNNARIDPIGCCVGVKGVRINAVSNELNGESIDCIEYVQTPEIFLAKALAPAQVLSVKLQPQDEGSEQKFSHKAIVQIRSDQKSKAIGKNGINIRLASMLCNCEIELIEVGAASTATNDEITQGDTESKVEKTGIDALQSLFKN
ncbi:transcription termination factor NusA [uncultured Helicobacter sp.]|uniref:transcription termination factor NusA n=1 Tax=uncultured Helicobacter sp. TaxID=175537 RepID=UPI0037509878